MKLGALRTPAGQERGISIHHLIGGNDDTLPEAWDLRGPWSHTPDQNGESCQGFAYAQALRTLSKGAVDPSAMAIYSIARWLEDVKATKLDDRGAFTHLILDTITKWGIVKNTRWPDEVDPTLRVPQDVFEAGSLALVNGIYRIEELGSAKVFNIKRALHQGHPVTYAIDVGKSFKTYKGGIWQGETEPILGGHANCLIGYTNDYAISANSYGADYGENGYINIAWKVFEEIFTTYDFQVLTLAPGAVL